MLRFITKDDLWRFFDKGYFETIGLEHTSSFVAVQAAAVYECVRLLEFGRVLEVGKGDAILSSVLGTVNDVSELWIGQASDSSNYQRNIPKIGDIDGVFEEGEFDLLLSVNLLNSVSTEEVELFLRKTLRLLRPGGFTVHAMEFFIEDEPSENWKQRFDMMQSFFNGDVFPIGAVEAKPRFSCDLATIPDSVLLARKRIAPQLDALRRRSQGTCLLLGGRKMRRIEEGVNA